MKKILFVPVLSGIILLLFTHPAVLASGCTLGLTLWYSSVLPSLLPFFILSGLLVRTGMFRVLNRIYAPMLRRIFHISDEGCYAVLFGFLCGFPMGAKAVADLVREKSISAEEGDYLLGFCNNVSPAFFLNYVCLAKLGFPSVPWRLALVFYALPVLYGIASRPFYHFPVRPASARTPKQASWRRIDFPMLDTCIMDGFSTVTRLGGYIILFAILVQFLKLLPIPALWLAILSAALEISCGIDQLGLLAGLPYVCRAALICAAAALGGLCICAQTQSVLEGTPLHIGSWLLGRLLIALLLLPILFLPGVLPLPPGTTAPYGCL